MGQVLSGVLDYKEAAAYLGVAEKTLRTWVCQCRIDYIKYGAAKSSRVFFRPEDLDAFLGAHLVRAMEL